MRKPPGNVWRRATQSITGKVLWFSDHRSGQIVQLTGCLGAHVTFVLDINRKKKNTQGLTAYIYKPEGKPWSIKDTGNKHLSSLAITASFTQPNVIPGGERPQPPPEPPRRTRREWPRHPLEDWLGDCRRWGTVSVGKWGCLRPECRLGRSSALPRCSSLRLHGEETVAACWRMQRRRRGCNQSVEGEEKLKQVTWERGCSCLCADLKLVVVEMRQNRDTMQK